MNEEVNGIDCKGKQWIRTKLKTNMVDLTNKQFGYLTAKFPVVLKNDNKKPHLVAWLCQCHCGKEVVVLRSNLVYNKTKSCGCLQKKRVSESNSRNLVGSVFGRLTVQEFTGEINPHGEKIYLCLCECGNYHKVATGKLTSGDTKSCGCLNSFYESEIKKELDKNKITYITQFSFTDLIGTARPLRFDFAIFQDGMLLCLIEYNGIQHYVDKGEFGGFQREVSDVKKKEYCITNNIPLIILNKENYSPEFLINEILKLKREICYGIK